MQPRAELVILFASAALAMGAAYVPIADPESAHIGSLLGGLLVVAALLRSASASANYICVGAPLWLAGAVLLVRSRRRLAHD